MIVKGQPSSGLGGGVTIGTVSSPYVATKHTEANTIWKAFGGDGNKMFIGMLKRWNQYQIQPTPLLNATQLAGQVLETPGFGAELEFFVPYKIDAVKIRANIVDISVEKIGAEQSEFPLVLSDQLSPGDIVRIKSVRNGFQVRISDDKPIEPFSEGDGWVHQAKVASNLMDAYIPREFLTPGTAVYKTDNRGGEHSVHATSISKDRNGMLQQSYKTGNSEIRIKHTITSHGDLIGQGLESKKSSNVFSGLFNLKSMSLAQQDAIVNFYNLGPDGKPVTNSRSWMPTIFYKMIQELALMKEWSLTWNEGFSFYGKGDQRIDVPTGYYHQVKQRGHYFQYDDLTNIVGVMKDMMDQLFFGSRLMPKDRRIKFTMGRAAMLAAQRGFGDFAFGRNPFQIVNDGKNPITNGIFTGDTQNLSFKMPRVVSVEFPEYGLVEIEHNEALDYLDDEADQSYTGMHPNSSYIIWVQDVTADEFSNAIPRGATPNVASGFTGDANIVMLKPATYQDTISFLPGTGYNPTLNKFIGQSPSAQIAVSEEKGFRVVMDTVGELLIKDASRIIIAEYVPPVDWYI